MATFPENIRKQFPILHRQVNNKPLVYFDNAATTQKPEQVLERLRHYYEQENSNIHRGAHYLSNKATEAYEEARNTLQSFINARHRHEIIFNRGTTEAINLVAHSFCKKFLDAGDEILISAMEHHSNIVPWQIACNDHKATLKVIPINKQGELVPDAYHEMLGNKTKLLAITHVSNALGTINPVKEIIEAAHQKGIPVLIDGAQAAPHIPVDVQDLNCDFYCLSSHKMYGPMGAGILYGKEEWLNQMPPYQSGGEMIKEVSFNKTSFNELPYKFEAGTPNVADVLGMEEAIRFIRETGQDTIARHENDLLQYATDKLRKTEKVRLIGTANNKTSVISFLFEDIHPYDAGTLLDKMGIAVRTGHHCAQPVMDFFQIPGTIRISFAVYNTHEEIDVFTNALSRVRKMFE